MIADIARLEVTEWHEEDGRVRVVWRRAGGPWESSPPPVPARARVTLAGDISVRTSESGPRQWRMLSDPLSRSENSPGPSSSPSRPSGPAAPASPSGPWRPSWSPTTTPARRAGTRWGRPRGTLRGPPPYRSVSQYLTFQTLPDFTILQDVFSFTFDLTRSHNNSPLGSPGRTQ